MASLIPQNFINELLDRTDIVELIDSRVSLRKTGRNYSGLCPFHQEKTPSFSVNPDKQFYYCFGCGAGGNAIGFLMEFERLEFRDAVTEIAKKAGMEIPNEAAQDQIENQKRQPLYDLLAQAQHWYQTQLKSHPQKMPAVEYLKKRGISGEIAKQFVLGYAPPGWDNLLQAQAGDEKKEQLLVEAGLLVRRDDRSGCYDRFRERIIFPIRDSRGRTIAFGGRVLGDEKPKYLNSPESPVFHKGQELYGLYEARQASSRITRFIIVEGYMDVIALAQQGIHCAVATLGTATSEAHLNKLFRMVPELIFCFDGDTAGKQAAARALEAALPLMEDGRQIKFLFLPEGEDPDTMVRREGQDAFLQRMDQATPLTEYFFNHLSHKTDLSSLDGKARLSKLALPFIQRMPRGVLHQLMLERLSQLTGLGKDQLQEAATSSHTAGGFAAEARGASANGSQSARRDRRPPARSRPLVDSFIRRAIKLLLQSPQLATLANRQELDQVVSPQDEETGLLLELLDLLAENPKKKTAVLLSHWQGRPEYQNLLDLLPREAPLLDSKALETEFSDVMGKLLARQLENTIEALLELIKTGQATLEQKQQLNQLLREQKN